MPATSHHGILTCEYDCDLKKINYDVATVDSIAWLATVDNIEWSICDKHICKH